MSIFYSSSFENDDIIFLNDDIIIEKEMDINNDF